MNYDIPNYRKFIPKLFLLFCIFVIPLSVFFSTGNLINFDSNNYSQTLSLKINTIPSFGNVIVNDKNLGSYNSDIRIVSGIASNIKISKEDFLNEEFDIYGPKSENSIMLLDPLFLLPNKANSVINNNSKDNITTKIIDKNLAISKKENKYYVTSFDFSGIKVNQEILTDRQNLGVFKKIDDRFFYLPDINSIMYPNEDKYKIQELDNIALRIRSIVKINDSQLLLLTDDNELYSFNFSNSSFNFVRSDVFALQGFDDNNSVFVLLKEGLIKLERGIEPTTDLLYRVNIPFYYEVELVDSIIAFQVKYIKNGIIMLINQDLYFKQDNLNSWKRASINVHKVIANLNTAYYLTNDGSLFVFRTDEQFVNFLGRLQKTLKKNSTLEYSKDWSKVLYYTDDYIESFSVNSDFVANLSTSPTIIVRSNIWLENNNCYPRIIEKTQFCIKEDNLVQYRNVNLFPIL